MRPKRQPELFKLFFWPFYLIKATIAQFGALPAPDFKLARGLNRTEKSALSSASWSKTY
jgi:hypothetical protein